MKTNKFLRIASVLLIAVLLSTCVISGTFAKYISSASGNDVATVAKWSFTVNGDEIAVANNATVIDFDLFATINDSGNTADEEDVDDNLIAPGTAGKFDLLVENTAEVTASYTITLAETNASNVPLRYSLNGTDWVDSIDALTMTGLTNQVLETTDAAVTHTVYWKWAFDGVTPDEDVHVGQTDTTDTALGIAAQTAAPQVTITASITATQVD